MEKLSRNIKTVNLGGQMIPSPAGNPVGIVVEHGVRVSIFLNNGIKLQGIIDWADDKQLVLREKRHQIIYTHSISTICLEEGTFLY
jgi:RNA chaperone Hfq